MMRKRYAHLFRLLAAACLMWPLSGAWVIAVAQANQHATVQKLTLGEIESLIAHGVPDATLSGQIRVHGIGFAVTSAMLDELRGKGAGPQTLAVIEATRSVAPTAPAERANRPVESGRKPSLSRTQLDQFLHRHTSDDLLARQIRASNLSFVLNNRMVDDLASNGAGPKTVAALREQVRAGTLRVQTDGGSTILVDGEEVGTTANHFGNTDIEDVAEGSHELTVRKAGFDDGHVQFTIAKDEVKQFLLPLQWAGGFLTVTAQPADAGIDVAGSAPAQGPWTDARVAPGTYTLTVSADGYATQTRSIQVAAGEHHKEQVQLALDPAFVSSRLADGNTRFSGNDFVGAAREARRVLKIDAKNTAGLTLLAEASFRLDDYATFETTGLAAIKLGGVIEVPVMHLHPFEHRLHDASMRISSAGIAVEVPPDANCKMPALIPFNLIARSEYQVNPLDLGTNSGFYHIGYLSKPPSQTRFIGIMHDLWFAPPHSTIERRRAGSDPVTMPDDAMNQIRQVMDLVNIVRQ